MTKISRNALVIRKIIGGVYYKEPLDLYEKPYAKVVSVSGRLRKSAISISCISGSIS
jgi:hypothetical protein